MHIYIYIYIYIYKTLYFNFKQLFGFSLPIGVQNVTYCIDFTHFTHKNILSIPLYGFTSQNMHAQTFKDNSMVMTFLFLLLLLHKVTAQGNCQASHINTKITE